MPTDLLQNEADCDLRMINTGDEYDPVFDVGFGESTKQHERDILLSRKGDVRFSPSAGVGIVEYLMDENANELLNEVRRQSGKDGLKIRILKWPTFPNGQINYDGYY